jgi:hypothetical protein
VAIIDVDCAELNGFEEEDRVGLEELARLIAASTDFWDAKGMEEVSEVVDEGWEAYDV